MKFGFLRNPFRLNHRFADNYDVFRSEVKRNIVNLYFIELLHVTLKLVSHPAGGWVSGGCWLSSDIIRERQYIHLSSV